jgi:alcohol dehydrogenase (cytochrome c)
MRSSATRLLVVAFALTLSAWLRAQVTEQDLRAGYKDATRWVTFSGDYTGQRHSPLTQITPDNVSRLAVQWIFQGNPQGRLPASPLIYDGVIYMTGPNDSAWAIDARTGRQIWRYQRTLPNVVLCCGSINRGFAMLGDRLFKATLDAHILALSMKTGAILWDTPMADYRQGYSATVAPIVVKDKVILGTAGGEYGARGFIDAYDAATGKRAWRFNVVPGPGEPGSESWKGRDSKAWEHGGGPIWVPGSYDPETNLVYWGTGNPSPNYDGSNREGDNLYTASLVALDADTGKLRWHYQFTPHDTHDWDSAHVPVLADLTIAGQPRKVVAMANRNGFFYVLDRLTGALISAKPYIRTTWAKEIGKDGRPIVLPDSEPSEQGTRVCPDQVGGTNGNVPSMDAARGLFFVTVREICGVYYSWKLDFTPAQNFRAGQVRRDPDHDPDTYTALRAIDAATGARRWEFKYPSSTWAGTMSTASGLVFAGNDQGNIMAFDARTGKNLWWFETGGAINATTTYLLDERQYVLVPAGSNLVAFALPQASR